MLIKNSVLVLGMASWIFAGNSSGQHLGGVKEDFFGICVTGPTKVEMIRRVLPKRIETRVVTKVQEPKLDGDIKFTFSAYSPDRKILSIQSPYRLWSKHVTIGNAWWNSFCRRKEYAISAEVAGGVSGFILVGVTPETDVEKLAQEMRGMSLEEAWKKIFVVSWGRWKFSVGSSGEDSERNKLFSEMSKYDGYLVLQDFVDNKLFNDKVYNAERVLKLRTDIVENEAGVSLQDIGKISTTSYQSIPEGFLLPYSP